MSECICNSCKNLKSVLNEDGKAEGFECIHGFPSAECMECESGECELTCGNYISDEEPDIPVVLKCINCGRELVQVCSNSEEGRVQCIDCYLKGGR